MKCRQCGTEIAAKALICYRCGTSVTEPAHKPAPLKKSGRPLVVYLVFAVLVLIAMALVWLSAP